MKHILLLLSCLITIHLVNAQQVIEAEGRYKLRIEKDWSENYAITKAKEMAMVNAIENAFGSVIVEGNTLYVKNSQSGLKNKSDLTFNSISNILVNGEWLKTLGIDTFFTDDAGYRWIEIVVRGRVRELKKISFTPKVFTLSCNNLKCSTEVFNAGQELVVYFKAPKRGYVAIYLDDSKIAQKLLPYTRQKNISSIAVEADKEYYFFYGEPNANNDIVDEIELFTQDKIEQNRMFVLYSEKEFTKPVLNDDKDMNTAKMPQSLPSAEFQEWLQKIRSYDSKIELQTIDITIKNTH